MFVLNIQNIYGKRGQEWLIGLPKFIDEVVLKFGLTNLKPLPNLSYNYVAFGSQGNKAIILKLSLDIEALKKEALALKYFENYGAARVLLHEDGLLLLEKAVPGNSLKTYFPTQEKESLQVVCNVMQRLHKAPTPVPDSFLHIKDWLLELDKNWGISRKYLQKARIIRDRLLQNTTIDILLHGDLHHDNIVQSGEEWVVIDPKGIIGEADYEVAAFIRNPIPDLLLNDNALDIISYRIIYFSEFFQLDHRRIIDWCFVQAVLCLIWVVEDRGDQTYFKNLVEVFDKMTIA